MSCGAVQHFQLSPHSTTVVRCSPRASNLHNTAAASALAPLPTVLLLFGTDKLALSTTPLLHCAVDEQPQASVAMTATVCRCVPSPHRHIVMPSRHTTSAMQAADSPVLFARYPLPPPPSHNHLSYLHSHPFSSHFSLYSDPLTLSPPIARSAPHSSSSRPVAIDSYDTLMAMRSLVDDIDTIHRESARRLDELLVIPARHSAADIAAAAAAAGAPSGLLDSAYPPSPLSSPPQQPPAQSPPPSGLSSPLLALLALHSHRLSSRALGLLLSVDRQPSCPICLSGLVVGCEVSVLQCGHCLHTDCLLPWLKKSGACPMCRARVVLQQAEGETEVDSEGDSEEMVSSGMEDEADSVAVQYEEEQRRWRRRWAQNALNEAAGGGLRDWRYA